MVPFAGFEMPIQYSGIIEEHLAVRKAAGIFDVSHMGEIFVRGPHALEFVQNLITNDAERLYDGRAMYTVMCRESGGIVDDLLVYRLNDEEFMLVVNASNRRKDYEWMLQNNAAKAEIDDLSDEIALIAVQGPRAFEIMDALTTESISNLKYYHFRRLPELSFLGCRRAIISHTGYTGEAGVEIYCEADKADHVWNSVMEAGKDKGLLPAGLGARDTLRIEAGYSLYGNDITESTNPLEAGLGWVTKLEKDDFIGKAALVEIGKKGLERKLVGFVLQERAIPRQGYPIHSTDGRGIGVVTSGTQSPLLKKGIGLGYVTNETRYTEPESEVMISIRGNDSRAIVQKPPFHKK
jgi:aminomethyltransferase